MTLPLWPTSLLLLEERRFFAMLGINIRESLVYQEAKDEGRVEGLKVGGRWCGAPAVLAMAQSARCSCDG